MDRDEEYVRRRHWSRDEKLAIVKEAATSGNVIGTAKHYGVQAQQIYRWRDRLFDPAAAAGFIAVSVDADLPLTLPAPVPDLDCLPASMPDGLDDRIEISSDNGVTVRLPRGSSADLVVAIAAGMVRRQR